jgi:hypothetical protein
MLVVLYHIQGQPAFTCNYSQTLVNSHDLKQNVYFFAQASLYTSDAHFLPYNGIAV